MSAPYLSQLRNGNRENPSSATIEQLAHFFRIDPAYFTDDAYYARISVELACLEAMHDSGIRSIAVRASDLSSDAQHALVRTIDELRRHEQLDAV
jgi:transcriptional regulator with XRE-family HTH domain